VACGFVLVLLAGEYPWWIVPVLMFWIVVIGAFVNGFIALTSVAKSSSSATPPFVFDLLPIFIVRRLFSPAFAPGYVPFLATPAAEVGEMVSIVATSKLGLLNLLSSGRVVLAYLAGYLPAIITTPFFALFLWMTFGIGTPQLPAPAFPVQGALISAFAVGDLTVVFRVFDLLLGGLAGCLAGHNLGLGIAIGFLFPPHMGVCLAAGGLFRMFANRRWPEDVKKGGITRATAVATGATFVIIPMVLLVIILKLITG
jgi:hypothetical protein